MSARTHTRKNKPPLHARARTRLQHTVRGHRLSPDKDNDSRWWLELVTTSTLARSVAKILPQILGSLPER